MQTINQEEELVFLYQLTQGTCDTSCAGHIANLVGLPQEIIKRGAQVHKYTFMYHSHAHRDCNIGIRLYSSERAYSKA